jgi:hypothetical protein
MLASSGLAFLEKVLMSEFLKLAAAVVVLSVVSSAILAKLFVVFARGVKPRAQPTNHDPESREKTASDVG